MSVLVPGGDILETPATRDLSLCAIAAWATPATRDLDSSKLGGIIETNGLVVESMAMTDCLMLTIEALVPETERDTPALRRGQLEAALRLAAALIDRPRIEPESLSQQKARSTDLVRTLRAEPYSAVSDRLTGLFMPPGDGRFRLPAENSPCSSYTLNQAQMFLDSILKPRADEAAPVEMAIVGDVELEDVLRVAAGTVGSLADRPRIGAETYASLRLIPRPAAALTATDPDDGTGGACRVVGGFLGPDRPNLREQRAFVVASAILRSRLEGKLEAVGAQDGILTWNIPGGLRAPGIGMMVISTRCEPGRAPGVIRVIDDAIAALAAEAPTQEELDAARALILPRVGATVSSPSYWAQVLASSTYAGYEPDDLAQAESMIAGFTPRDIHEVVRRYVSVDANRIRAVFAAEPAPSKAR
ncbi:MAG: insulinase family protein [Phycisphaeraceae bacterium]|nr:insulinase family protein [Phycisphaeraceae bacterium]